MFKLFTLTQPQSTSTEYKITIFYQIKYIEMYQLHVKKRLRNILNSAL